MYHGRFKGSHYEAGFNYGKLLFNHGKLLNSCPTFPITKSRIKFGKECLSIYEQHYPEIVEEIRGLADGNQTSFEFLSTMLLTMYCYSADNRCSCFAMKDENNIIFGRNSDFLVSIEKLYMNVLYKLDNVYSFNGNTTAFIEIEDGINEYGLAIGITFIASQTIKPGLNAGMLTRYILEKCKTTEEAIEFLKSVPIASAQTLTIADRTGNIKVVECNCDKVIVKEHDSYVYATNIFTSKEMKKYNIEGFDDWNALERYNTISNAFRSNESFSVEFAEKILKGNYGFICQYDRKQNTDTVWSCIYDIKNSRIYRVEGNPARKNFKEDFKLKFIY